MPFVDWAKRSRMAAVLLGGRSALTVGVWFILWAGFFGMLPSAVVAADVDIEVLTEKAGQGDVDAQRQLGFLFEHGSGEIARDYNKAYHWYKRAAEQGDGESQRPLGKFYELGLGVKKDPQAAAFWYRKAAEQGIARAMVNLGILYEEGLGVERDYEKALHWYTKSTEQHYPRGEYLLGRLYERGVGVARDLDKARYWYEKSAASKYSRAVGRLQELSRGGEPLRGPAVEAEAVVVVEEGQDKELVEEKEGLSVTPSEGQEVRKIETSSLPVDSDMVQALQDPEMAVTLAEQHFHAGNEHVRDGRFEEALREYEAALALDPDNANTLENLAITYAKTGEMQKGVSILEQAIAVDSLDAGKYASLGIMLHAMQKEDEALRQYRNAVRRNPGLAGIFYNMAVLFAGRDSFELAWKSLQLAEALGYGKSELRDRLREVAPEKPFAPSEETGGYHLRQIVVAERQEAEALLARLRRGDNFDQLAALHSLPEFTSNGGYMGYVREAEMEPQVREVIASLAPFVYSDVLASETGYHIYQRLVVFEDLLAE